MKKRKELIVLCDQQEKVQGSFKSINSALLGDSVNEAIKATAYGLLKKYRDSKKENRVGLCVKRITSFLSH